MANLNTALSRPVLGASWVRLRESRLLRQNLVLFLGGLVAGIGGFVYHAIAGRLLGPSLYGEVASMVAVYTVGMGPTYFLMLILARYAATLANAGNVGGIRHLMVRTTKIGLGPSIAVALLTAALAVPAESFLHLRSPVPVIWLGIAVGVIWQVAIPRGLLQGTQHFSALSLNLSLEMVVRTLSLALLLILGFSVGGAVVAILIGGTFSYVLGMASLRELWPLRSERVRLRAMAGFSFAAAAGTIGILLLYNMDVILAKHYLAPHQAGIYGGLNKVGTIIYFFTLSVSQVMFPRVVEAIANDHHPGRLLLLSGAIIAGLGACSLVVFFFLPGLVVRILFGPAFLAAVPFIFPVGLIGLGLSLDNLLVQFFMAAHDRSFMPILAVGCGLQIVLIVVFHHGVREVVYDVLTAITFLFVVLGLRCWFLLPRLHPQAQLSEAALKS